MPGYPTTDRRWQWDRRSSEERRRTPARRGNSVAWPSRSTDGTGADAGRMYVFRSFSDRRRHDDRRALSTGDRRVQTEARGQDGTVNLSAEEILVLLHQPEE